MSDLVSLLVVLVSAQALIWETEGNPLTNGHVGITKDAGGEQIELEFTSKTGKLENVEDTIKDVFEELNKLEVKALYQTRTTLERLVNETEKPESSLSLPKYVVSREEKVYIFTNPSKNASAELEDHVGIVSDQAAPKISAPPKDESSEEDDGDVLKNFLNLARRHTKNPNGNIYFRGIEDDNVNIHQQPPSDPLTQSENNQEKPKVPSADDHGLSPNLPPDQLFQLINELKLYLGERTNPDGK